MDKTKVGIVGMGTVGSGVARLLLDHGDRTARHAGRTLWLERVVVRDIKKPRGADLPEGVLSTDLESITNDPEIKVVAQLIGGLEPAKSIMIRLLESGKDIVTANKALLAEHGPELFDLARKLGRSIAFEAAVCAGVPIITNLSQCLNANQISDLRGILNGTSNFILTEMSQRGSSYQEALAQAQELGFAEADPTMDVDGSDAAQKLSILAHLAFGTRGAWRKIPRRGIDDIQPKDTHFASELGYTIKLIGLARLHSAGVELEVGPMLVPDQRPLAKVGENYNAINVIGDAVGPLFYHGQGAGQMPTASAVVADMIDMAVGRTEITFRTLKLWDKENSMTHVIEKSQISGRFYLRFNIDPRPGVLTRITSILESHQIAITTLIQKNGIQFDDESQPLVVLTESARFGNVEKALATISGMSDAVFGTECFRVLE